MDPTTSLMGALHAGQNPTGIDTPTWTALRDRFKGKRKQAGEPGLIVTYTDHNKSPFDEQLFQAAVYLHQRKGGWRLKLGVWMLLKVRSWMAAR